MAGVLASALGPETTLELEAVVSNTASSLKAGSLSDYLCFLGGLHRACTQKVLGECERVLNPLHLPVLWVWTLSLNFFSD